MRFGNHVILSRFNFGETFRPIAMKIKLKREGGFIGITSKADIKYDDMTADEQKALDAIIEKMKTPSVPPSEQEPMTESTGIAKLRSIKAEPPSMMRDVFSYSISIRQNGKTLSCKFGDQNAPSELVELFQKYVQY
jgi:hypothetical protein